MDKVILYGNEITSKEELHKLLKRKLSLPDYYGNNLDALWDCLTGYISMPLTVELVDFEKCKKNIGEYANKIVDLFEDAVKEVNGFTFILK